MPAISSFQAARLVSISRDAKAQSEEAIRASLRLLRRPTYPCDRCATLPEDDGCRVARSEP